MKPKSKTTKPPTAHRSKTSNEDGRRARRRRLWLWLVAVFLAVTLLAGECATLLPVE